MESTKHFKKISATGEYKRRLDLLFVQTPNKYFQLIILLIALLSCLRIFGSLVTFIYVTRKPSPDCETLRHVFNDSSLTNFTLNNVNDTLLLSPLNDDLDPIICQSNSTKKWIRQYGQTILTRFECCVTPMGLRIYEAMIFIALAIGGLLFSLGADYNGRHAMMVVACLVDITTCFMGAFSQYFAFWAIMKLVSYGAIGGQLIMLYTILIEFLPRTYIVYYRCVVVGFMALSYVWVTFIAYYIRHWTFIEVVALLPCLINIVLATWYFYDSPLWAYVGCEDRAAKRIVRHILQMNGEEEVDKHKKSIDMLFHGCGKMGDKWKVLEIFENAKLCQRSFTLSFIWFAYIFFYFHLTLETEYFVGSQNLFYAVGFMSLTDAFSSPINFLADRFLHPRKSILVYSAACFICIIISVVVKAATNDAPGVVVIYFLFSRMFALCGWLHTMSLVKRIYPGHMQGTGVLFSWLLSIFWTGIFILICAPILGSTSEVTLHCLLLIISCILTFLLPRILGRQFARLPMSPSFVPFDGLDSKQATLVTNASSPRALDDEEANKLHLFTSEDDEEDN